MKTKRGAIALGVVAFIVTGLLQVQPANAATVLTPYQIVHRAATAAGPLTTKAKNCLLNANTAALPKAPSTNTQEQTVADLTQADVALLGAGGLCADAGSGMSVTPGATEGGPAPAGAAIQAAANPCWGEYSLSYNENGHTTSFWVLNTWVGWGCWVAAVGGNPYCFAGSSWPSFALIVDQCYVVQQPQLWGITVRIIFHVTQTTLWIVTSQSYWYWVNYYSNGGAVHGCRIC
jgi:hypothetical protein